MKPPQQSLLLHVPHDSVAPPSAGKGYGEQPRVKRKDGGDSSEAGWEVVDERERDAAVSADKGMKQSRHHYHHRRYRHRQARIGLIRDGHGAAKGQRQSYLNGDGSAVNNEFRKRNSRGREEEEEEESRSEFESRSRSSAVREKEGVHDNGKRPSSVTRSAHQQEMVDNVNSMSEREHKENETQHKKSSRSMDRMVAEAGEGGSEREDGEVESDGDDDTAPIAQEQDGPEIKRGIIETLEKPQRRGGWQQPHHIETSEDIGCGHASGTERVGEEGALLQTLDSGNKVGDSQEQVLANASKSLVETMELDEGAKGIAASTTADALEEIKGARESLYAHRELEMSRTSEAGCKPVIAMMQDGNEMSGDDLMRRIVKDQLREWEKIRGKEVRQEEEEEEERACAKKQRVENGALLSLALPDTSLSLSSGDPHSHQSFLYQIAQSYHPSKAQTHTHSSGFTNLISLSHSQPFHHNPSCSLTQSSLDKMEMSSGSQQISQVKEQESHGSWQMSYGSNHANEGFFALPVQGKQRPKPLCQRLFQSGNDHHSLGSECLWNQGRERGESDIVDIGQGSHQVAPADFELQATHSSDARQQQKHQHNDEVRSSPSHGESSRDTQPRNLPSHVERIPSREKRLLERGAIGPETFTSIQVQDVVSESIPLIASKLQEKPDSFLEGRKGSLRNKLKLI
jgi:hypothetical protein